MLSLGVLCLDKDDDDDDKLSRRDLSLPRLVHSHWSKTYITALSLVETFPSDAGSSNLMP